MKKLLLLLSIILMSTSLITSTIEANASSWHKGSPKIACGTWTDKSKYPEGAMYDSLFISKSKFILDDNDPHLTNLKYKKVDKRSYKFRGYEFELGKTITAPEIWHFISKHHVRTKSYGHVLNLYK
mgnify:CR=1 FL=1